MSKVEIAGVDTGQLPKLSNAEQLVALAKIRGGDKTARANFIHANMRLVLSVIQRYIPKKNQMDDMFQVGCIGLIKAIDNFDPRFGVQFSTYAVPMIIGEIRRFLRDTNSMRISRSLRDAAYKALVAREKLFAKSNREPTIEEIALEIGLPYKLVLNAMNATSNTLSLDDIIMDEGSKTVTMLEKIAGDDAGSDKWIEDTMLKSAIVALAEREREILLMRYYHGKTQIEVSTEVGISQAQVSRLEKNAVSGIKRHMGLRADKSI
jgi:RNA polymerase sporulation-specific sigma factor